MAGAARVHVALGARSYDILAGPGLLAAAGAAIDRVLPGRRCFVVTDETVAKLFLAPLDKSLAAAGISGDTLVLPAGEASKSFGTLERTTTWLLDQRAERRDAVLALGGGVIGDLAGFAAAITLRGMEFVQLPTTLLAQVDSSVGGKTGINTRHGKNLVGSFTQPRLVVADTALPDSLPRRELLAGYAEMVKYGVIGDAGLFAWLEQNHKAVLAGGSGGDGGAARQRAVVACCEAKAAIVAADEREAGQRALLNLGHTFGHALEAATGFGPALLHGEAVAAGMAMAMDLSVRLGLCPAADAARVRDHLASVGLPTGPAGIGPGPLDPKALLDHMRQDKKVRDGRIALVLCRRIGEAFLTTEVTAETLADFLADATAR